MELSLQTLILLPIGLGLLGFIEPCSIGGHLIFLETQKNRSQAQKFSAAMTFLLVRSVVAGLFGLFIAYLGQRLIGIQTGLWLVFGGLYLLIGLAFLAGRAGLVKWRIDLAPAQWRRAKNPLVLGLAFGLNIPACAAPILFGLLGLAATGGNLAAGFWLMFLFGMFLTLPILIIIALPAMGAWFETVATRLKGGQWAIGIIFVLLGLWSIWFGLFVDPANWVGT